MTHLDTHVLVWLYGRQRGLIPDEVAKRLDADRLAISPTAELELTYLYETGRVSAPAADVLADLAPALELSEARAPFPVVVRRAAELSWTRDPFDRLIVAHALADEARLLTADATILAHSPAAIWPT